MSGLPDPDRLNALIRRLIGWQIDGLQVELANGGLLLWGRAYTSLARALTEVEAARLSGLPVVENRIVVERRVGRRKGVKEPAANPLPVHNGRSSGRASSG
jgi:hypothetical protein